MSAIKVGPIGKIRLFLYVLNHPWETYKAINEFLADDIKNESMLNTLREENSELREKINNLERGQA
jgi:cell division protein FtsB